MRRIREVLRLKGRVRSHLLADRGERPKTGAMLDDLRDVWHRPGHGGDGAVPRRGRRLRRGQAGERSVRILDWFHIGMRFEHLLLAIRGLREEDPVRRESLMRCAQGAKWLLRHGQYDRCRERLISLRRETGWVVKANVLSKLVAYVERNRLWLTNYGVRRAKGLPISSAGAESVVDYVVGQRMKRNGHMRWTRTGANHLLQVRCAALNGQDVRNFKRWYPPPVALARAA